MLPRVSPHPTSTRTATPLPGSLTSHLGYPTTPSRMGVGGAPQKLLKRRCRTQTVTHTNSTTRRGTQHKQRRATQLPLPYTANNLFCVCKRQSLFVVPTNCVFFICVGRAIGFAVWSSRVFNTSSVTRSGLFVGTKQGYGSRYSAF